MKTTEQIEQEIVKIIKLVNDHLRTEIYEPGDFVAITYNAFLQLLAQTLTRIKDQPTFEYMFQEIQPGVIKILQAHSERIKLGIEAADKNKIILDS